MPPTRSRRPPLLALAASLVLLSALAGPLSGQGTGTAHQTAGNGLKLLVDTRWTEGGGYRPVRIEITPTMPVTAARTLTVEFKCNYIYGGGREMVVGSDIEIPEGTAAPLVVSLPVPAHFPWQSYEFEVWEDGRLRPNLSFKGNLGGTWGQMLSEGVPSILIAGDAPADTSGLAQMSVQGSPLFSYVNQYGPGAVSVGPNGPALPTSLTLPLAQFPRRWLEYTSVDLVCLSLDELSALKQRGEPFAALGRWVAAGGNLCVYNAPSTPASLVAIERLLEMHPGGSGDSAANGWLSPDPRHYTRDIGRYAGSFNGQGGYGGVVYAVPATPQAAEGEVKPAEPPPPPDKAHFVFRPLGLGLVVALAPPNPFPGTPEEWGWLLNTIGEGRYMWYRRHGLSLQRENQDFWNWLIRGVGQAPVTPFRFMITAFVIVIGPLNYYWLRRRGKLHLMLVLVPLVALLVTGSLFAYALVADGLGVRARVRSYTEIDQRQAQAVCWSRISYYAGLSPAGGFTFAHDVAVLPLDPEGTSAYQPARKQRRTLDWTSDGQRLVEGWIKARTPVQFVTLRSRASKAGVQRLGRQAGGELRVENRLGTRAALLLLRDEQGTFYVLRDLAAGAVGEAAPADAARELASLREAIRRQQPELPPGGAPGTYTGGPFGVSYSRAWYPGANVDDPAQGTGRLEAALAAVLAITPDKPGPLVPGSYVALVDRSPEVDLGLAAASEEDSLHVVVGRW